MHGSTSRLYLIDIDDDDNNDDNEKMMPMELYTLGLVYTQPLPKNAK